MDTTQIIKYQLKDFWKDKPVRKAYLFGSAARQELTPESDIDILVELDPDKIIGMIEYIKIINALEKLLKRKVDLITTDSLSPHIGPVIDLEKLLIYEG